MDYMCNDRSARDAILRSWREYVAGDSFDEIHWKATARRQNPLRSFSDRADAGDYVVIDASRLSERKTTSRSGETTILERPLLPVLSWGSRRSNRAICSV